MGWDSEREGVKKNLRRTKKEKPRKQIEKEVGGWMLERRESMKLEEKEKVREENTEVKELK